MCSPRRHTRNNRFVIKIEKHRGKKPDFNVFLIENVFAAATPRYPDVGETGVLMHARARVRAHGFFRCKMVGGSRTGRWGPKRRFD